MKKLIASFLLFACAAAPALAQTPFYAGAEVGDNYLGILGGYQIDKTFSVEVHYYDFDKKVSGPASADAYTLGITGLAMVPVKLKGLPPFSLYGSVGVDRTEAKVTVNFFGTTEHYNTTNTDVVGSVGAQYDFTKNLSARAGVHFNGEADSLYLNAIYKF